MPLIDYAESDDLDEQTREMVEGTRTERGNLPSFTRMLANNPAIFRATMGQFGEVMFGGGLDVPTKQLAFVVVSQENECAYCAATHGDELVNAFGVPEPHLEAIASGDYSRFTDRQRAVAEFARQGGRDPKRITDEHVEALRAAGFDDADVIELTSVIGQAAFANTVADAMDVFPNHQNPELEQYYPKEIPTHE